MPYPLLLAALGSAVLLAACGSGNSDSSSRDTTVPVLAEVTPVLYGNDTTPSFTFSSSEAGTITWGGGCSSVTTLASSGNNTITFSALDYGVYSNCTVKVTDKAGNASATLAISTFSVASKPYNDTGIMKCGDYAYDSIGYTGSTTHNNDVNCINGASPSSTATQEGFEIANGLDAVPAGQDAHFGRDANPATNSDADGHKGFSFTKLSAVDGVPLAIQNGIWSDAGSEAAGTQWGCVQDNVTGLVWEVKTNDGGLRDKDWTYSWYSTDSTNNGGSIGYADYADNCYTDTRCDTQKYLTDVNAGSGLCGATDWRLPRKEELQTLVAKDRISPTIDSGFIPNTISNWYWSATTLADGTFYALGISFNYGGESINFKQHNDYVRLVRGGN